MIHTLQTPRNMRILKRKVLQHIIQHAKRYCIILLLFFLIIGFMTITDTLIILTLIIIASFSMYYKRFIPFSVGADLCAFLTVFGGARYGLVAGFNIGLLSFGIGMIIGQSNLIDINQLLFGALLHGIIGIIAGFFSLVFLSSNGIFLIILLNIGYIVGASIIFGAPLFALVRYSLSNIVFNILLFNSVGETIATLLAGI